MYSQFDVYLQESHYDPKFTNRTAHFGLFSYLGNVELMALTGSLFYAQTYSLLHLTEEFLTKCEGDLRFVLSSLPVL